MLAKLTRCMAITKDIRRCKSPPMKGKWLCRSHSRLPYKVGWAVFLGLLGLCGKLAFTRLFDAKQKIPTADIAIVVEKKENPVFWLHNPSSETVRDPKYNLVLFNLSTLKNSTPRLTLQIPVKLFSDYILPDKAIGPWRIQELSEQAKLIEPGHVVFGYGTVQCSNCATPRYFWLKLHIGQDSWISEVTRAEDIQKMKTRLAQVVFASGDIAGEIDKVIPKEGREPIL